MAIDRSQIIDGIYNGVGIPAIGPLAPDVFGYDPNVPGLEYDPEKAKELLAEAGFEDGFSTTLWTNDNRERMDMATNIQAQLKEFGIEVEIEVMEWEHTWIKQLMESMICSFLVGRPLQVMQTTDSMRYYTLTMLVNLVTVHSHKTQS